MGTSLSSLENADLLKYAVSLLRVEADSNEIEASNLPKDQVAVFDSLMVQAKNMREVVNEWNQRNGIGCEVCGSEKLEENAGICQDCINNSKNDHEDRIS